MKKYWLDIIAIFPFYLVLRVIEEVFLVVKISGDVSEGQKAVHGLLEFDQANIFETFKVERGVQEAEKITRARGLLRAFAPAVRMVPRLVKLIAYYLRLKQQRKKSYV